VIDVVVYLQIPQMMLARVALLQQIWRTQKKKAPKCKNSKK
jgi:hypothetical protein